MTCVTTINREFPSRRTRDRSIGLAAVFPVAASLVIAAIALLSFEAYSGLIGIIGPSFEVVETSDGKLIRVPPGGNLQAAIDRAESGDIIELSAGEVYMGGVQLRAKPLNDFVTIRTSAIGSLPEGKRVTPDLARFMAVITAPPGKAAVTAANGSHHYRFVGIEFTPSNSVYNYALLSFGGNEKRPELVPHHIEVDRSYLHPFRTGKVRRGIALNSADTVISNSYIEGFGFHNEETQGIAGWTGTRDVKIINNHIEGGAENILFGGADPANADLIPTNIEVRGNNLTKPRSWAGSATVKTIFQLKNARRVKFTGNTLTNNWEGSAFRITVRNQDDGAPFSTIEDVLISDNVIIGSGDGINILGKDDTYPSQTLRGLKIINNLFIDIGVDGYSGSGYFVQVADGEDIVIANNTALNRGNIATFYGSVPRNFSFRDNIVGHGNYGIHGLSDIRSELARSFFQNNLIVDNLSVEKDATSFPPGNIFLPGFSSVGFIDFAKHDFRLSMASKYRSLAEGGKNMGCDPTTLPVFPKR